MQKCLEHSCVKWTNEDIKHPFEIPVGINTGCCHAGHFGSVA
ncbi:MAG: hypothetical protein SFW66_09180 [Gammaproteobacteria bacterium]|nr:hypothetical protein [Gammaproteobacteria bacterium]